MQELFNLEPAEVSLVTKGANKKKFLIFKSANGGVMPNAKEIIEMMRKSDPAAMAEIEEVVKAMPGDPAGGVESLMDPKVAMALKAIARILLPFKDQITYDQICEVLQAIGIPMDSAFDDTNDDPTLDDIDNEDPDNMEEELDPNITKEHMEEANKAASDAYCGYMKKMGFEKYPTPPNNAGDPVNKKNKVKKNDKPISPESGKEDLVEKAAIIKADGSLDLSAVPEAVRPAVELIYKGQQDAVKKAADLETQLKVERDERVSKEMSAKADSWKHLGLPKEDVIKSLHEAHANGKESFERVCKMFDASNAQVEKSALFKEIGSNREGTKGDGSWQTIEKAALGFVEKSGQKMSAAEAVTKFLDTPEGSKMYGEYKAERGGI